MSGPLRRAGLIVNPRSGKGSGKGQALAEALRGDSSISLHVIEHFGHLEDIISSMAREQVTDLFISSGDGTIQEILTLLAERRPFPELPRICLLPHGTTNLSANDLGFVSRSIATQAAFLRKPEARSLVTRNTIRCLNPGDGKLRHGMFVGTGAMSVATHYCQQAFNEQGVTGQWAVAKTLMTAVGKYLFSRPDAQDEGRFDRPYAISVDANGRRIAHGTQLLQISTTLDTLLLNSHPFWGGKTAPIRTTVLPYPVPSVPRWMLPIMYGGENHASPPGATSFCSDALEVYSDVMFVIDGEFFPPPVGEPLRLETGPLFTFIRS
ncbi:diacylglycerol kinase family protein [Aestuariivirga sp.]|uniref:diacylglycerol/lipid kinase family protein n=1 Tax=Aestuariivirga sp. TaxID=2650926 RepID=UPI0030159676